MIRPIIIGAPFGNYLSFDNTTSTIGTFTWKYRANLLTRLWKILTTVRYYSKFKSWINKLGLPNPDINGLKSINKDNIISIHGFNDLEWLYLAAKCHCLGAKYVELNYSCPNVDLTSVDEADIAVKYLLNLGIVVICKLAPIRWMSYVDHLFDLGVRYFHLCNTIPSVGGGFSGKLLMQYSLWAIEEVKEKYGNRINIIGGGGITCIEDVEAYKKAGVNHVSVASMLLNPLNWLTLKGKSCDLILTNK